MFTLETEKPTGRRHRRPKHKFQIRTRPYAITPFLIAPVLPAETLTGWWCEAREVTDPIKNPLVGWASEFFMFYVKIRDLADRDTLDDLFINPTGDVSSLNAAADIDWYHSGGCPNFTQKCVQRITETYFRDEGEAWNNFLLGDYPVAQFRDQGVMDSLLDTTVLSPGVGNPAVDATTPEALDKLMDAYEQLRAMSFTQMSFEDYCATFGINLKAEVLHKPELIGKWNEWQYPSNTVDPATGAPSSAVSWVHKKSDKTRKLFKEPGFIVGIHIVRPKVYLQNQTGSVSHWLDKGLSWLPAIMSDMPETSLREFASGATSGPFGATPTNGYWVDMRDLFMHGDQFVNFALTEADAHLLGLPTAALNHKYIASADADELFKSASPANQVRSDGFVSLDILGSQVDYTGGHQAEN